MTIRRVRVLLVLEDADLASVVRDALSVRYDVAAVPAAATTAPGFAAEDVDVVIAEPRRLQAWRGSREPCPVPVLLLREMDERARLEPGAGGAVLTKPVSVRVLERAVDEIAAARQRCRGGVISGGETLPT